MYRKRENKIADAIKTDSNRDKMFSYVVLFVISLLAIVMGYILEGLISSLTTNMESMSANINTMAANMTLMQENVSTMASNIQVMNSSITGMSTDIHTMSTDVANMAKSIDSMDASTKTMKGDLHDINKLNPLNFLR